MQERDPVDPCTAVDTQTSLATARGGGGRAGEWRVCKLTGGEFFSTVPMLSHSNSKTGSTFPMI